MSFVKRNIELEEYLNSENMEWNHISDQDYKNIIDELNSFISTNEYVSMEGDSAYQKITSQLPGNCYIFSSPKHKYFSIYSEGGPNLTFGYKVVNFNITDREKLNKIECVVANVGLSFCCVFNHEWQASCPEVYYEKNA